MALLVWVRHKTSLSQAVHWNVPDRKRACYCLAIRVRALALFSDVGEFALHRWIPESLPITEFFQGPPVRLAAGGLWHSGGASDGRTGFPRFSLSGARSMDRRMVSRLSLPPSAFTLLHGAQLGYAWAPLLLIFVVGLALTVTRCGHQVRGHLRHSFT